MAKKKPSAETLEVPAAVRDELVAIAGKAGRSTVFVAARALSAAPAAPPAPEGPTVSLALVPDEDDPPGQLAKVLAQGGARLAAAWLASRERFLAWAAKAEAADRASQADDLDAALVEAADPATAPARLALLARSEYPRVRARVAAHPAAPAEVRAALARDRDRTVREAATG